MPSRLLIAPSWEGGDTLVLQMRKLYLSEIEKLAPCLTAGRPNQDGNGLVIYPLLCDNVNTNLMA